MIWFYLLGRKIAEYTNSSNTYNSLSSYFAEFFSKTALLILAFKCDICGRVFSRPWAVQGQLSKCTRKNIVASFKTLGKFLEGVKGKEVFDVFEISSSEKFTKFTQRNCSEVIFWWSGSLHIYWKRTPSHLFFYLSSASKARREKFFMVLIFLYSDWIRKFTP